MAAGTSRRCNVIRGALAIAALITAAPAFAQMSSPEPAVEAKPPSVSALSEAAAERARPSVPIPRRLPSALPPGVRLSSPCIACATMMQLGRIRRPA
jgi:hypothetical protein